jgi:hypothetical protein
MFISETVSFPAERSEAKRGEGNPGVNATSGVDTWVPFPRRATARLAGDDKFGLV